jgi:dissimilatory sulfite reductase related protein
MAMLEINGVAVELDSEGFLRDHRQWNEDVARAIAREEGINELSERHWTVVCYMRDEFAKHGEGPSIRKMKNAGGIPVKELYELFPGGPAKKAARIAGIPKPHGCV